MCVKLMDDALRSVCVWGGGGVNFNKSYKTVPPPSENATIQVLTRWRWHRFSRKMWPSKSILNVFLHLPKMRPFKSSPGGGGWRRHRFSRKCDHSSPPPVAVAGGGTVFREQCAHTRTRARACAQTTRWEPEMPLYTSIHILYA